MKQTLLKTASVLLQDERYKVPIDEVAPQPSPTQPSQPRRT
ncbi:hypothetical protein VITU9109_19025 [Vibrio tubiashii ATCC 19109]|uniref:Uncharacterized protein n=1 Tax=Vibrio tubiashii ATCC 19109 TaxID=1051646 RepID=A0ABP2LRT7_9VIBR|nr:hypothetical protein VITU9109_19025 [Vibrio tubiashii ATCC 19109]